METGEGKTRHFVRERPAMLLWIVAAVAYGYLALRNAGLYPVVMPDEWSYNLYARLLPVADAKLPSYLYYLIFKGTNLCGAGFLECARALNGAFFVAAIPFIYLVARRYCTDKLAVFIAALSMLGANNTYTAYFMPEALYYLGFWMLTWVLLAYRPRSTLLHGVVAGIVIGAMALIKTHALFLLPAIALFIAWRSLSGNATVPDTIKVIALLLCFAAAVRFFAGYLIAGKSGLSLFGTTYGSIAGTSLGGTDAWHLTLAAVENLKGHLMTLALLFGVPVAAVLLLPTEKKSGTEQDRLLRTIKIYIVLIVGSLLGMVAAFTAVVSGSGPYETVGRLHLRYYNFVFPLFLIVPAAILSQGAYKDGLRRIVPAALIVGLFALYAFMQLRSEFIPSFIDNPELRGITRNGVVFGMVSALGIVALIAWSINQRLGAWMFLFVCMPVTVLSSAMAVNRELRHRLEADVYDRAGMAARQLLSKEDIDKLVIAASDGAGTLRSLFQLDTPNARTVELPREVPLEPSRIPPGTEWVLVIGNHELPSQVKQRVATGEFSLVRLSGDEVIDFRKAAWPGLVSRISGLSVPENWGTWSSAGEVRIDMAAPLPMAFDLHLRAQAFGPNAGKEFVVRIGENKKAFRLSAAPQDLVLHFATNGTEKSMVFDVPEPTAPRDLGLGGDERRLGLGITRLRIVQK